MKQILRGENSPPRLVEVLRNLKDQQYYGTLLISDGPREKCFFFARGGLRMAKANCREITIGDYLKAQGYLQGNAAQRYDQDLQQLRGQAMSRNQLAALLQMDPSQLDTLERTLMAAEFLETLFWRECYFEYRPGDPEQEAYQKNLNTSLLSMGIKELVDNLIEVASKIRDLKRAVPNVESVAEITDAGQLAAERPSPSVILRALKEPIVIRELATKMRGWTEYDLIIQLNEMMENGYVHLRPRENLAEDDVLTRIRHLEEGLDLAISPIMRRQALAKTYKDNNDEQAAARHFKKAGQLMLQSERAQEASKELRQAYDLVPEDFEAQEGLVDALWASKNSEQARIEAQQLSRRYFDLGLSNRARMVLEKAVQTGDRDLNTRNMLVRAYLKLGRSEKALDLGRDVCADLRAAGREDEALNLAERFVDAGVDQERVLVMSGEKRRRLIKKVLLITSALLLLLLLPVAAATRARLEFHEQSLKVQEALNQGDYLKAQELLTEYQFRHEWGSVRSNIEEFKAQIVEMKAAHDWFQKRFEPWLEKGGTRIQWRRGNDIATAKELIRVLAKHPKMSNRVYKETYDIIDQSLREYYDEAIELRAEYKSAFNADNHEKTHKLAQRYFLKYDNVQSIRSTFKSIGIPFQFEITPSNAKVVTAGSLINESKAGKTRICYFRPRNQQIIIELDGYESFAFNISVTESRFKIPPIKLTRLSGPIPETTNVSKLVEEFQSAYKKAQHSKAHKIAQEYYRKFPNDKNARRFFDSNGIPFRVKATPNKAIIRGLGKKAIFANTVVYLKPGKYSFTIESRGYVTKSARLDSLKDPFEPLLIRLKRRN